MAKSASLLIKLLSFWMVVTTILLSSLSKLRLRPAVLSEPLTLSGEKRWYSFMVW